MDLKIAKTHIEMYKNTNEIKDGVKYLLRNFNILHENFSEITFRESNEESILMTADGDFGEKIDICIPENIFDFDLNLVLNMLAHEMMHVEQKSKNVMMEDRNEREFLAYYEMIFHEKYPLIPDASLGYRKTFIEKAFIYYNRMGENSHLQLKFKDKKNKLEKYLLEL